VVPNLLNAEIFRQNDFIALMTYDDEHHRIATRRFPESSSGRSTAPAWMIYSHTIRFRDLVATYKRLRVLGITPFVSVNDGLATSMHYRAPDGNGVELQIEPSQSKQWMRSGMSKSNPVGVMFDSDELAKQYDWGCPKQKSTSTSRLCSIPNCCAASASSSGIVRARSTAGFVATNGLRPERLESQCVMGGASGRQLG